MITVTQIELEKIKLLDKLFCSLSLDELRKLAESEQIIAKLKGSENNSMLLESLINNNTMLSVDMLNLKNETLSLKADFQTLLKTLSMTVFSYSHEMNNLKQKHNIY